MESILQTGAKRESRCHNDTDLSLLSALAVWSSVKEECEFPMQTAPKGDRLLRT